MRILIYRLGSLGDTVLALPCFHLIREIYPEARIEVLTNAPVSGKAAPLESILAGTGLIDGAIHYPLGLRDPLGLLALAQRLREEKFDLLVSLAAARGFWASVRDGLFFRLCGIPRIVGLPFARRDLTCRRESTLFEPEWRRLLRRIESLGQPNPSPPKFDLRLTPEERAEAGRLLTPLPEKFIAASLGTKTALNDWGLPRWKQLLGELSAAHPGLGLVLLGSADEAVRSRELLKSWAGPALDLCGATSPRVSAAVLARTLLFLGHDSGPMHLAAAAGTRCIAIFSARCPPGQWFPAGEGHFPLYPFTFFNPARTGDLEYQQEALGSIGVEQARAAAGKILDDGILGKTGAS
jgi:ADP-heptose:LPS heptosyltransferase